MRSNWNDLCSLLADYEIILANLGEYFKVSKASEKIKKQLSGKWDEIVKKTEILDKQIDPLNPDPIQYPFESERFKAMWKYYKDYLEETHGVTIESRVENCRLKQLFRFSRKEEERAMLLIETLISNKYKNVINLSDKQLTGEENIPEVQSTTKLSLNASEEV